MRANFARTYIKKNSVCFKHVNWTADYSDWLLTCIPMIPSLAKSIRLIGRSEDQFVALRVFSSRNFDSCFRECVWENMIRWNVRDHHIDIFWYVVDKRKWTTNLVMEPWGDSVTCFWTQSCFFIPSFTTLNNRLNLHSPLYDRTKSIWLFSCSYWWGPRERERKEMPGEKGKVNARDTQATSMYLSHLFQLNF